MAANASRLPRRRLERNHRIQLIEDRRAVAQTEIEKPDLHENQYRSQHKESGDDDEKQAANDIQGRSVFSLPEDSKVLDGVREALRKIEIL